MALPHHPGIETLRLDPLEPPTDWRALRRRMHAGDSDVPLWVRLLNPPSYVGTSRAFRAEWQRRHARDYARVDAPVVEHPVMQPRIAFYDRWRHGIAIVASMVALALVGAYWALLVRTLARGAAG